MTTLDQTGRADLNDDALFDAEIVIGHRAVPYLKGQVLHSVSPAATPDDPWSFRSCERPRVKIENQSVEN